MIFFNKSLKNDALNIFLMIFENSQTFKGRNKWIKSMKIKRWAWFFLLICCQIVSSNAMNRIFVFHLFSFIFLICHSNILVSGSVSCSNHLEFRIYKINRYINLLDEYGKTKYQKWAPLLWKWKLFQAFVCLPDIISISFSWMWMT